MNDDTKKEDDPYQGVKIERLDTVGKPLTVKGTKWNGNYVTTRLRKGYSKRSVKRIVEVLSETHEP